MSTKLHEVLAAEPNVKQKTAVIANEGLQTFKNKQSLFTGQIRTYQPKEDGGDQYPPENQHLVATVPEKLKYVMKSMADKANLIATKEETNTGAKADLTINGDTVTLGATTLLALEKEVKEWRTFLLSTPTLEPGFDWEFDDQNNYFKSEVVQTLKMKKIEGPVVLYPATDKHPAQVQMVTKDEVIGTWDTQKLSGAITSTEKAEILNRLDDLEINVKQARQRANTAEVTKSEIGTLLTKFVLEGS